MSETCEFCGQVLETDEKEPWMACNCLEAMDRQRTQRKKDQAFENMTAIFGQKSEKMGFTALDEDETKLITRLVVYVGDEMAGTITVKTKTGEVINIKNETEQIKISRKKQRVIST